MMNDFPQQVENLLKKIEQNNIWRQRECINLIPSESTPSLLVRICEICDSSGRYAEHRKMKGNEVYFYQGIDFIRDVEIELEKQMLQFFKCANVELRPISGQMANEIVFEGVTKFINREKGANQVSRKIRSVVNNDLTKGGHLSDQPMGALFKYVAEDRKNGKEKVFHFPVMKDNPYKIDTGKLSELIETTKPELIIFGKSMVIYKEPVRFIHDLTKDLKHKPVLMYDMAHTLGLYGIFQDPLAEGADIVSGSTHKTFFGPQRGVIISNIGKGDKFEHLWGDIRSRAFPGSMSNHHLGTLLALLMATYEMNAFKNEFQHQVISNARAFAWALYERGIDVEGDRTDGFTETHQVILRVRKYGSGEEIALKLEKNNIITNYQALPDDDSFLGSSGIRMGVQEMTRFGMKETDFAELAEYMADCIKTGRDVSEKIKEFREKFQTMQYCLPSEKAVPMTMRILASIFSDKADKKYINTIF
jgi:glycine/serine hydroxymethyltransferase